MAAFRIGETFIPNSINYEAIPFTVEDVHYAMPDTIYWVRNTVTGKAQYMLSGKINNKAAHYQKLSDKTLIKLVRNNDRTAVIEYVKRFKQYPKFIKKT